MSSDLQIDSSGLKVHTVEMKKGWIGFNILFFSNIQTHKGIYYISETELKKNFLNITQISVLSNYFYQSNTHLYSFYIST